MPSPKSHSQLAAGPIEVSAKLTVSGEAPVTGVAVKLATGATPAKRRPATIKLVIVMVPAGPVTMTLLRSFPPVTGPAVTPSPNLPGGADNDLRKVVSRAAGGVMAAVKTRGITPTSSENWTLRLLATSTAVTVTVSCPHGC